MVKLTEQIVYIRTKTTPDSVKKLNLWGCEIDDIKLCERMKNLEVLSLSVNKVKTLGSLRNCHKLRELYLRNNLIGSLSELENLKHLKDLRVLWIDENPCTIASDYRHKVVSMLPQLNTLDDSPISMEDIRATPMKSEEVIDAEERGSTLTLIANPYSSKMNQKVRNGAIVDSIMPSQFVNCMQSTDSSEDETIVRSTRRSARPKSSMMSQSFHPLMASSNSINESTNGFHGNPMNQSMINIMSQSMYQPYDTLEEKEEDWADFSIEEEQLPSSSSFPVPFPHEDSPRSLYQPSPRSLSLPRRRLRMRTDSTSPAREIRLHKMMSAVNVLLDELDADGLRCVIEEAQKRLKKER